MTTLRAAIVPIRTGIGSCARLMLIPLGLTVASLGLHIVLEAAMR